MEIRQLVTFAKITEEQSFSKAAKQLGYSQSAVTVQIRLLEEELGVKLFERIGSCSRLTERGRQLKPYADRILAQVQDAKRALSGSEPLCTSLCIGAVESVCLTKLPPILKTFRLYLPHVSIRVITADSPYLLQEMEQNRLDLIYLLDEQLSSSHWKKALEQQEPLVFVSSPSFAASKEIFQLESLTKEPLILTEAGSDCRRLLDRILARHALSAEPAMELHDRSLIIRMLKNCHGVSFLPYFVVKEEVQAGNLSVLPVPSLHAELYRQIFYHKEKYLTREMKAFIHLANLEQDQAVKFSLS